MTRKSHKNKDLMSLVAVHLDKSVRTVFMWIDDKYNTFIQDFFLDEDSSVRDSSIDTLAYGTTLEWNLQEREDDYEPVLQDNIPGVAGFITKAKRSFHLYMELDTLDPEENLQPQRRSSQSNPGHVESSDNLPSSDVSHVFRISRWNLIRLYFKNIFRAITNPFRIIRSFIVDNLLILKVFIPFTLSELKIRGPSQRC